jgi:hypothetical protein
MIDYKALEIITENTPTFFYNSYYYLPNKVKIEYLKKFLKKEITTKLLMEFISSRAYYSKIEEYKKSEHFLILKNVLNIDLEKYDWLINGNKLTKKDLDRDIKLWQIQRD